jgi:hypothetical protein
MNRNKINRVDEAHGDGTFAVKSAHPAYSAQKFCPNDEDFSFFMTFSAAC